MSNKIKTKNTKWSTTLEVGEYDNLEFAETTDSNHLLINCNFDFQEHGLMLDLTQVKDLINVLNSFKSILEYNNVK